MKQHIKAYIIQPQIPHIMLSVLKQVCKLRNMVEVLYMLILGTTCTVAFHIMLIITWAQPNITMV